MGTGVLATHHLDEAGKLCDRIAVINKGRLVANEPTRDLTEPPSAVCFDRMELRGARVLAITYNKSRVNAGEVLAAVTRDGLGIVDVVTKEADLEDVFLSLTRVPSHPS